VAERTAKTWEHVRAQRPLNEPRVATYRRLIDAELALDDVRRQRRVNLPDLTAELDERGEDVYLATVARYVTALGGHLEVNAIFDDTTLTLLCLPE
jgi:hypothetical protein